MKISKRNNLIIVADQPITPERKTAQSLYKIIEFAFYRVPPKDRKRFLSKLRGKIIRLNPADIGAKEIKPTSTIGQGISFAKNLLSGLNTAFVQKVLAELAQIINMEMGRNVVPVKAQSADELIDEKIQIIKQALTTDIVKISKRQKNYVKKKKEESGNITYIYSEKHIKDRNLKKMKKLKKLYASLAKLRTQVKKDLHNEDLKTRYSALAVALIDETYARVGNMYSASDSKHYGVTTWLVKHVKFSGSKAIIDFIGKSGVKQHREVKTPAVVKVLREVCKGKKATDKIFDGEDYYINDNYVNQYLRPFNITAKDIRGLHANEEMRKALKQVRKGKLPSDKGAKEKQLKKEFKEAVEIASKSVGHEPGTLKNQYLIPTMEPDYISGAKIDSLGATEFRIIKLAEIGELPQYNKRFKISIQPTDAILTYFAKQNGAPYKAFGGMPNMNQLRQGGAKSWVNALQDAFDFTIQAFLDLTEELEISVINIPRQNWRYDPLIPRVIPWSDIEIEVKDPDAEHELKTSPIVREMLEEILPEYILEEQDQIKESALKTPCQTPGAIYHTEIKDKSVEVKVDLPEKQNLSVRDSDLMEKEIHNALEGVLSKHLFPVNHDKESKGSLLSKRAQDPKELEKQLKTPKSWKDDSDPYRFLPNQQEPPKGYTAYPNPYEPMLPIKGVDEPHIPLFDNEVADLKNFFEYFRTPNFYIPYEGGNEEEGYTKPKHYLPLAEYKKTLKYWEGEIKNRLEILSKISPAGQKQLKDLYKRIQKAQEAINSIKNRIVETGKQQSSKQYRYDKVPQKNDPKIIVAREYGIDLIYVLEYLGIDVEDDANSPIIQNELPLFLKDKYGRQVRTGKILEKAKRMLKPIVKKMKEDGQLDKNQSEVDFEKHLLKMTEDLQRKLETLPKAKIWHLVVSAEPSDIKTMSTGRGWTSCVEEGKCNFSSLDHALSTYDMVAYAVDDESNNWLARVWLRNDGKGGWWPESQIYGTGKLNHSDFLDAVENYLKEKGIRGETAVYHPQAHGWSDFLKARIEEHNEYVNKKDEKPDTSIKEKMELESPYSKWEEWTEKKKPIPYGSTGGNMGTYKVVGNLPSNISGLIDTIKDAGGQVVSDMKNSFVFKLPKYLLPVLQEHFNSLKFMETTFDKKWYEALLEVEGGDGFDHYDIFHDFRQNLINRNIIISREEASWFDIDYKNNKKYIHFKIFLNRKGLQALTSMPRVSEIKEYKAQPTSSPQGWGTTASLGEKMKKLSKRAEELAPKPAGVEVVIQPLDPAVQKAVQSVKSKEPNLLKNVTKVIVHSGGGGGELGHVESGPGKDPREIHIYKNRIDEIVKKELGGNADPKALEEAIQRALMETISHEAGHIGANRTQEQILTQPFLGEGEAENQAKEFLSRTSNFKISVRAEQDGYKENDGEMSSLDGFLLSHQTNHLVDNEKSPISNTPSGLLTLPLSIRI